MTLINDAAGQSVSGSITSAQILDGTIVNADVSASAAITASKLSGVVATANNLSDVTASTARGNLVVFSRGQELAAAAGFANTHPAY